MRRNVDKLQWIVVFYWSGMRASNLWLCIQFRTIRYKKQRIYWELLLIYLLAYIRNKNILEVVSLIQVNWQLLKHYFNCSLAIVLTAMISQIQFKTIPYRPPPYLPTSTYRYNLNYLQCNRWVFVFKVKKNSDGTLTIKEYLHYCETPTSQPSWWDRSCAWVTPPPLRVSRRSEPATRTVDWLVPPQQIHSARCGDYILFVPGCPRTKNSKPLTFGVNSRPKSRP